MGIIPPLLRRYLSGSFLEGGRVSGVGALRGMELGIADVHGRWGVGICGYIPAAPRGDNLFDRFTDVVGRGSRDVPFVRL